MQNGRSMVLAAALLAACAADPGAPERGATFGADGKADALSGSCQGHCDGPSDASCWCDDDCAHWGDCCEDAAPVCGVESNRLDNRVAGKSPLVSSGELEVVADLPFPPGNVTVAADGRIFHSYFPLGNKGDVKVAELVDGRSVAYPSEDFQDGLHAVLGLRVDQQDRLWLLDYGLEGVIPFKPRLIAIDLASGAKVFQHEFSLGQAPLGSMLNDLVISADGKTIYIADQRLLDGKQAILVVELGPPVTVKRRLVGHRSVAGGRFDVFVNGGMVAIAGVRPGWGIDGIALDQGGANLYYAALNSGELYRVPTATLRAGSDAQVVAAVGKVADVTMSDGITMDAAGNVYLTDMEHFAVTRASPGGDLDVVVQDARLRWPDGFAWEADGSLLLTCSALHQFIHKIIISEQDISRNAPYQIFRFTPPPG